MRSINNIDIQGKPLNRGGPREEVFCPINRVNYTIRYEFHCNNNNNILPGDILYNTVSLAVPQSSEQGQGSPFDSFEVTESFDVEVTSMPSLHVTGSLTNRNPRVVSEYQNVPQQYIATQPDYRYVIYIATQPDFSYVIYIVTS